MLFQLCAMFTIKRIAITVIVLIGVLLWLRIEYGNPGIGVDVEPRDAQLAEQVVNLVESDLRQLPIEHPVIARYGQFKSMVAERTRRMREHELFGEHYPATLEIDCHCEFAKYDAQMNIVIVYGTGPSVDFSLEPAPESLSAHSVEYVPVKRSDELWYDRGEQGRDGWHSLPTSIECLVSHPEFQPQ